MKERETEGEIEKELFENVLGIARAYLGKQIEDSGWDPQIVVTTHIVWSEVLLGMTEEKPDEKVKNKFYDLGENIYFKNFLNSGLLQDMNKAMGYHSFPGTNREDRENVAFAIRKAFTQVAEEYSDAEE